MKKGQYFANNGSVVYFMNVNNKIVFLDGMFPAIIFPVGLPEDGGTCAYLTEHCLLYCPTQETNKHERRAYKFFEDNSATTIINKILEDMCDYNLMHLYWWPWGDCLPEIADKISDIMLKLSAIGILQNGYTRNKSFWRNINFPQIDNLRIGLHADTVEEAKKLSINKIICCPDVTVNKAELYFNQRKVARCCGIWCDWLSLDETKNETRAADCQECFVFKQGCFYQE